MQETITDLTAWEARLASIFVTPPAHDLPGLIHYALTSELHGRAIFESLASAALDPETRGFWEHLAAVEAATAARLTTLARRHGVSVADPAIFATLGKATAAYFVGLPPIAYFRWIGPAIAPYTETLNALRDYLDDPEDRAIAALIVDHEIAIERCNDLLADGIDAAVKPLAAHLTRRWCCPATSDRP